MMTTLDNVPPAGLDAGVCKPRRYQ